MKQFYLFVFICVAFISNAQVFEHSFYSDQFSSATVIEASNSGGWYVAGRTGLSTDWVNNGYVIKLDGQGNVIWKEIIVGEVILPHQIKVLDNDDIIVTGNWGLCDVLGGGFNTKIDSIGQSIWFNSNTEFGYLENSFIAKPNNQIASIGAQSTIKYHDISTGLFINEKATGTYTELYQINDSFSVATSINNDLILLDNNEDSLNSVAFGSLPKKLKVNNGFISIALSKKLFVFDTILSLIDTINFVGIFEELIDYSYQNNGYHLLGRNQNDYFLNYYGQNGDLINSVQVGNELKIPASLNRKNDTIVVIGHEQLYKVNASDTSYLAQSSFIQGFLINNPVNVDNVDIKINEGYLDYALMWYSYCPVYQNNKAQLHWERFPIELKNNGNSPINKVEITWGKKSTCIPFCNPGYAYFNKDTINNLNLLPNDSTMVYIEGFFIDMQEESPTDEYEFCIWALSPNGKVDDNLIDNYYCKTVIGVNTNQILSNNQLKIFPNPTNELLNLNFVEAVNIESFRIINNLGQIVQNQVINEQLFNHKINVSALKIGIYTIEVKTKKGRIIKRFIKE